MSESALTGKVRLGDFFVESEKFNALIHGISINDFHIVELGLAHLNGIKPRQTAKHFDIVIAPAAKMHSSAIFFEEFTIIWHSKFTVKIR